MGNKYSNAQAAIASPGAMSQGIASAFGDDTEEAARKRREQEDQAAAGAAQQTANPNTSSLWEDLKGMSSDAAAGWKGMASDAGGAWNDIMGGSKKKK